MVGDVGPSLGRDVPVRALGREPGRRGGRRSACAPISGVAMGYGGMSAAAKWHGAAGLRTFTGCSSPQ